MLYVLGDSQKLDIPLLTASRVRRCSRNGSVARITDADEEAGNIFVSVRKIRSPSTIRSSRFNLDKDFWQICAKHPRDGIEMVLHLPIGYLKENKNNKKDRLRK